MGATSWPNALMAGLALALLLWSLIGNLGRLATWSVADWESSWAFSELLINYQGGVVRRGLIGEVLHGFTLAWGVPPQKSALVLAYGLSLLTFSMIVMCVRRDLSPRRWPSLMAIALSPTLLLFSSNDVEAFGRKDPLILLPLIAHLEIARWADDKTTRVYVLSLLAVLFPVFIAATAAHELTLLTLPIHWYVMSALRPDLRVEPRAILLSGLLAVSAALGLQSGGPETSSSICSSWWRFGLFLDCPNNAIGAISWELRYSVAMALRELSSPGVMRWGVTVILIAAVLYVAVAGLGVARIRRRHAAWFAAAYACPLLFIGIDWGRWVFLGSVIYLALTCHPAWRETRSEPGRGWTMAAALAAMASPFIALPACCIESYPLFAGPFGGVLR